MNYFPPPRRTPEAFSEHFIKENLKPILLVAQSKKTKERHAALIRSITEFVSRQQKEEEEREQLAP